MVFYKITLSRSLIGVPHTTRSVVKSLGLSKRGSVVYRQVTPQCAGSLAKCKELVSVEVTEHALTGEQQRELRKSNPGFTVEKRMQ
ncbi:MRPL33 (YMR286W) [Zygosaccharomyces parabailii]|uniref:Large ribosomal subunit protein uL30m n=1 Tax=Zygosaccharomyces bailii (strain CLIB 213 / ATCC 58445 / CBS 680 / BCRC 21525 / NBRC 1098 / NCYC 1416 / NRRL Y-2227) TaxID=1333698 RepID=A0A8J2T916_ZYGB2|nr:MRPL33 (YMR286W) [Zygosaccharomyces parabailii]CDF89579.1 ZYBA0S04-07668g1_1 [Zygosaccharomyces bailii CLIB 213]SJM88828.1 probable 54S ribosomal protein L33, mitochondrial [Zygosaccharomyces bailii]